MCVILVCFCWKSSFIKFYIKFIERYLHIFNIFDQRLSRIKSLASKIDTILSFFIYFEWIRVCHHLPLWMYSLYLMSKYLLLKIWEMLRLYEAKAFFIRLNKYQAMNWQGLDKQMAGEYFKVFWKTVVTYVFILLFWFYCPNAVRMEI